MYKLKRKKLKKLNEEEKFNSFLEKEKYIYSKYQGYDSNGLLQFEKYLNGRLGQFTRNYTQTTKRGLLTTNKG